MWCYVRGGNRVSALVLALGWATVSAVVAQGATPGPMPFAELGQIKKFVSVEVLLGTVFEVEVYFLK